MNAVLKNTIAIVAGLIIGSLVNGGLIGISGSVIPPPNGIDVTTEAGLKAALPLFEPKHFVFPFLAHALGTLVGTWVSTLIAANRKLMFALIIGCVFLLGGIIMVIQLPAPLWFNLVDLILAYIPMALLGWKLGCKK